MRPSRIFSFLAAVAFAAPGGALFAGEAPAGPQANRTESARQTAAAAAAATAATTIVPPAPVAPLPVNELEAAAARQALLPENVGGLSVVHPGAGENPAPVLTPQNRVLPANVDNAAAFSRETAYSPNWLLDGVRLLEAGEKRARNTNSRSGARADSTTVAQSQTNEHDPGNEPGRNTSSSAADAAGNAASNDPLAQYLQKWLSTPGVAGAIAISQAANPDYGAPPPPTDAASAPGAGLPQPPAGAGLAASPQPSQTAASFSLLSQLTEPLMEAAGTNIVLPPPPIPPETPAGIAPAPEQAVAPPAGVPAGAKLQIKSIDPKIDPSKPLVNDKKYFPQFQRF